MQTKIETITSKIVVLTFDNEADARAFVVDPKPAQKMVKAQLANGNGHYAEVVKAKRVFKKRVAKKKARVQQFPDLRIQCQYCERKIASRFMNLHVSRNHKLILAESPSVIVPTPEPVVEIVSA